MRQASGDLFPTDVPIPASQLIGRGDDVREVATALENGTNLILAGPRRTGKTSVCDAALGRVERSGCYTAGWTCSGSPTRPSWRRRWRWR